MNEKESVEFQEDELGKVVFYNMNAFWKPIKTAIFLGGMEFEHYKTILQKIHKRADIPVFEERIYQEVLDQAEQFILPSVAKGIGQFPDSNPRIVEGEKILPLADVASGKEIPTFFSSYETAFAVLNLSLAIQTKVSFDRAGIQRGMQVFTEGGFSKNDSYNTLLTGFFPDSKFYLTGLKEASAFGAAMCGKAAAEGIDIRSLRASIRIDQKSVPTNQLKGLQSYYNKFIGLV
jgi:sugar (pentulose or hexulose) kinase